MKRIDGLVYYQFDDRNEPTSVEIWGSYRYEDSDAYDTTGVEEYSLKDMSFERAIELFIRGNHISLVRDIRECIE